MKQEITRLVYDAAVEIAMPPLRKAPKARDRIQVKVTNNTQLPVVSFDVSMMSGGSLCMWRYAGDPIPPGDSTVTLEVEDVSDGQGRMVAPDRPARVQDVRFAEAEAKAE